MTEDVTFSWKTRGKASPKDKPRVFFTCHPDDMDRYIDEVCGYVLEACDCAIYYTEDMRADLSSENSQTDLGYMNLFVVPVTFKLLTTPNRAMDEDLPFAKKHHIAILPLMMEPEIESFYSDPKKFGELQYLNPYANDLTALGFDEKLRSYLDTLLVDPELANRIRAAFDAYVFLSYRKKDRSLANDLMRTIHDDPSLEYVAIWFDEYLIPGENFKENIGRLLDESKLFMLLVTPNLLEKPGGKPNFVMGYEYPAAVRAVKAVLPAEAVSTDHGALVADFPEIPKCFKLFDRDGKQRFLDTLKMLATTESGSPEQTYLIGLAYLDGIDVERDSVRALRLLEHSANGGSFKAMEKLFLMYRDGDGVELNYWSAFFWANRLCKYAKRTFGENHQTTITSLNYLAKACSLIGDQDKSLWFYQEAYEASKRNLGEDHWQTLIALEGLATAYGEKGDYVKSLELCEQAYELIKLRFGEDHPWTVSLLAKTAGLYLQLGDISHGAELSQRACDEMLSVSGDDNPNIYQSFILLASALSFLGDPKGCLKLAEEAYSGLRRIRGETHPGTLLSLSFCANARSMAGDYVGALELSDEAYEQTKHALGERHPQTLRSLFALVSAHMGLGDYAKALDLSRKLYEQMNYIFGRDHPDTLASLTTLALAYGNTGDYTKALELSEQAYDHMRHILGENNPQTLNTLFTMALVLEDLGKHIQALEYAERAYEQMYRTLGDGNPITVATRELIETIRAEM